MADDKSPKKTFDGAGALTFLPINKLAFILLILAPFASNYRLYSAISIGDALVILCTPWFLLRISIKPSSVCLVLGSAIVIAASYLALGTDIQAGFYRIAVYFFLFFVATSLSNLDVHDFFRPYILFSLFASFALIVQWLLKVGLDIVVSLQLPLPHYEPDTITSIDHVFRSGGLFREPSYFSIFVAPALFYLLIARRHFAYGVIAFAGIVSTSSLIVFLIFISGLYVLSCKARFLPYFLLFAALLCVALFILRELLPNLIFIERIANIFEYGGTLVERFTPLILIANTSDSLFANHSSYTFYINENHWFNSASSILAYLGFAGIALMIVSLLRFNPVLSFSFLALLITTHLMSNAYGLLIAIAFATLHNMTESFKNLEGAISPR